MKGGSKMSEIAVSLHAKKKKLNHYTGFDYFLIVFMGLLALITAFPFYYMLIVSFGTYEDIHAQSIYLWPTVFDTSAYELVIGNAQFWSSVRNTLFVTVVGTALSVVIMVAAAYPLTKKTLFGGKFFFNMLIFTMFFGGGMIPGYLVVEQLGLGNSIWCMIFPCLIGPFNIILIKNYIEDLPLAIEESAKIDGANDMVILFKIILPMSTPIIATVALFVAVGNWNSYWMAMLHINKPNLYPLQLLLRNMLLNTTNSMTGVKAAIIAQEKSVYDLSLQMATVTVATVPILVVYPFVQKYFTKGIMLGGVKG